MAMQFKDYYETLGVSKTASADEIKKAFRKLARQYHPDVAKDKKTAEQKFKEINEAYEVLGDAEKRQKYDTLGADWQQPGGGFQQPPNWRQQASRGGQPGGVEFEFGGTTGFSDFFEAFFGGGGGARPQRGSGGFDFGGFGQQPQAAPQRGRDVEADILVTLREVFNGAKRKVSLRRSDRAATETYEVKIPAGVREGQRIRLAGQGESGSGGAGDLYLRVRLAQDPDFRVEGNDLIHEVDLAPWQAALGAEVSVTTLDGVTKKLKIPAGTQSGQRFRLRQRGLPAGKGSRGDLYVVADIEIPKSLTAVERELWEKLAAISR